MRCAAWLLLLTGCERLLGLGPISPLPADGADGTRGDAAVRDAPLLDVAIDAPFCTDHPADPMCHDEDGDGVVDALDNCPTATNPPSNGVQTDTDGDGVGDQCDPHPTTIGDSIASFAPFAAGFDGGWSADVTGWTAANDAVTSPAGTTTSSNLVHALVTAHHPTIEVRFEFLAMTTSTGSTFGEHLDFPSFPGGCRSVGVNTIEIDDNNSMTPNSFTPDYLTKHVYLGRLSRDYPLMSCAFDAHMLSQPDQDVTDTLVTPKISVDLLQVRIDSIVIYASS
ncbi:MAG: thrombospondin type 3 repeat-containing protein [Acidobacteriota bacterium]